ncbi:hypothetical protein FWH30_03235 [Microgenomates group bacterium]|nr:hypothetical protein [Microgenomates group bacterium]
MRKIYWYVSSFLSKYYLIILISLLSGFLLFSFLIPQLIKFVSQKERRFVALIGDYSLENLPSLITNQVSFGLMKASPLNSELTTSLAKDFTISEDGLTYTFTLKEDLLWQDNQPLHPNDIHYNLPEVHTEFTDNQIIYTLPEPFSPFTARLTKPLLRFIPTKKLFRLEFFNIIGIGDYAITDYTHRQHSRSKLSSMTVESSEKKIIYRFYLTQEQAITAFKKGEVNEIIGLNHPRELEDWPNLTITRENPQSQYLALFFNLADERFPKNIRQAFGYALTKNTALGLLAFGPINDRSWAFFKGIKRYDYSLDRAIERLVDEFPAEPLEITLTTNSLNYDRAIRLKDDLEMLGERAREYCLRENKQYEALTCDNLSITININVNNFPDLNNFELLLLSLATGIDPDQYTFWHSDQPNNFTNYKNTRVDALLEEGRQVQDQQERTLIYQEFQQVLSEDVPAIFLEYDLNYNISRGQSETVVE